VENKENFSPTPYEKNLNFMNTSCLKGRCIVAISKKALILIAAGTAAVFLLGLLINRPASLEMDASANEWEQMFETDEETPHVPQQPGEEQELAVDIKGAVKNPGVYEMEQGDRITDAIQAAGGFAGNADQNQVNLAAKVKDELVIYVPQTGELPSVFASPLQQESAGELVNINTASTEELQTLNGIGPAKAEAIIAYREEKGGFQKKEDLLNVSGIGEKSFEKMEEAITVQ
jgi:competence protein ComEA